MGKGILTPVQWYGGKGLIASKIAKYVPEGGSPYCEPYCGGASLFFRRQPAKAEVLNDIYEDLINMYRCLQNPESFQRLRHVIQWTLHSRAEFVRALSILRSDEKDAVLRAWAVIVAYRQSVAASGGARNRGGGNWARNFVNKSLFAQRFADISVLDRIHKRLLSVQIDCRDALEVIRYWDNADAVFYIDPPYIQSTRKERDAYKHEANDEHHKALVSTLLTVKGAATLSCYWHEIYRPLTDAGWRRVDIPTVCFAPAKTRNSKLRGKGGLRAHVQRVETLLINPAAQSRLEPIINHAGLPDAIGVTTG